MTLRAPRGEIAPNDSASASSVRGAGKKRGAVSSVVLVIMLVAGVAIMSYPAMSDWLNSSRHGATIVTYEKQVSSLDQESIDQMRSDAQEFNEYLSTLHPRFGVLSEEDLALYSSLLNVSTSGVMGSIRIPSIGVNLPIYHGVDESVLQVGIGHVESTSLPIGGPGTHVVLSGHRGLPSARLFTDLDRLKVGDRFELRVLGEVLTYEVDQIITVLPDELESLSIYPDQDLVTLVTCTPYGINTHRLLVRGHRVEGFADDDTSIVAEAARMDPLVVSLFVALPILAAGIAAVVLVRARMVR